MNAFNIADILGGEKIWKAMLSFTNRWSGFKKSYVVSPYFIG